VVVLLLLPVFVKADDVNKLYASIIDKLSAVRDYTADIQIKVSVSFINIPKLNGRLYYKAPDKMRLERHGGISILPKKNINFSLRNMLPSGNVTILDLCYDTLYAKKFRVVKIIPSTEQNDIVISKVWIDDKLGLIIKTETTTRNQGTITMNLEYGAYLKYSLPDKVTLLFDVNEYKLPKGLTMDYEQTAIAVKSKIASSKKKTGTVEIFYMKYNVNSGISDDIFNLSQQ
jgi:outer membrane lipoprotein-sorting protein